MEWWRNLGIPVGKSALFLACISVLPSGGLAQEVPATAVAPATPAGAFSSSKGGKGKAETRKLTAPAEPAAPVAENAANNASTYRIGIEDELMISVWHEPELSMPVVVRPDGMITLPLVNDLPVVGLTTQALQDLLSTKLKAFVNEPQVTVTVRNIRSRKVYLIGQVSRPGAYPLITRKTVLQLLAEAGGLGPYAKAKSIYVLREEGGRKVKMGFDYKKAVAAGDDQHDLWLHPGDMIVVP